MKHHFLLAVLLLSGYQVQTTTTNKKLDISLCSDELISSSSNVPSSIETKSLSRVNLSGKINALSNHSLPLGPISCTLELNACAVCRVIISWKGAVENLGSNFMPECLHGDTVVTGDRCMKILFEEEAADIPGIWRSLSLFDQHKRHFANGNYTSSAYKLKIKLKMAATKELRVFEQLFPLNFTVVDNTVIKRGKPRTSDVVLKPLNRHYQGYIESPRYPYAYPDGVQINYTLINEDGGPVRLLFEDFQLHYMSVLKILNSNEDVLLNTQGQFGGTEGRPSPVQSTGDRLTLIFMGNHYTHEVGFRAQYIFVTDTYWPKKPVSQNCDGVFESAGGVITIPSINIDVNAYIDCLWIIGKSRFASKVYDKLYLKVAQFEVESNSEGIRLEIREGRTSLSRQILDVWGPKKTQELAKDQPLEGFIADLKDNDHFPKGFYVRLRGYLSSYSGLSISFAQFYRWATAMCNDDESEFHCDNGRCIKSDLRCDRRDHCGDFSDEKGGRCSKGDNNGQTGGRFKAGKSSTSKAPLSSTLILVAALIGLALVMILLAMVVARIYRKGLLRRLRHEAAAASLHSSTVAPAIVRQRQTVEEYADQTAGPSLQRIGDRRFYVLPETEVGIFEAPPTYSDALKHPTVPPTGSTLRRPVSSGPGDGMTHGSTSDRVTTGYDNTGYRMDPEVTVRMSAPIPLETNGSEISNDGSRPPSRISSHSSTGSSDSAPSSVVRTTEDMESRETVNRPSRISGILKWAKHRVGRQTETNSSNNEQPEDTNSIKSDNMENNDNPVFDSDERKSADEENDIIAENENDNQFPLRQQSPGRTISSSQMSSSSPRRFVETESQV